MAITLTELQTSRTVRAGDTEQAILRYVAEGSADEQAILTAVEGTAPATYDTLVRQDIDIEPAVQDVDGSEGVWNVEVTYVPPEDKETSDSYLVNFDTGGGTQHITQSLATIQNYPIGTAPDHKGAIGVTKDSVEGVDILLPVYNWSQTHYFDNAAIDATYIGKLFALTGRTNNASFKGCAAGECLFRGASGSRKGDGQWEVTFSFAGSPNRTGLVVGDLTGIAKEGWEYLWVEYTDVKDGTSNSMVKRPFAAHVERVYDEGDFSDLGIGT